MRIGALLVAGALLVLGGAEAAQAIDKPRVVRAIGGAVAEGCYGAQRWGYECLGSGVVDCRKTSRYKVRCTAWQHFERRGNWRECVFRVGAVENRRTHRVRFWLGRERCYTESGEPIY